MKHPIQVVLVLLAIGIPLSWAIWDARMGRQRYEQQQSQSPIGHGMVYWYPADISYAQSGKPYPLQGHTTAVVGFSKFEMP